MHKFKKTVTFTLICMFFLFATTCFIGCSGDAGDIKNKNPEPDREKSVSENTYSEPVGPPDYYVPAPFTGIKIDPKIALKRPVAVMIENAPAARPQSGLSKADIVYEVLAEGAITRFLAIYHSQNSDNVGPVRSARPYYIERALEYNALYAHCGGSEAAKALIKTARVPALDEFGIARRGGAYWRIKDRKAPHNLYGNIENIRAVGIDKGYKESVEIPEFKFLNEGNEVEGGLTAKNITVKYPKSYSEVAYQYTPEKNTYLRFNGGKPHLDEAIGKQLSVRNIIVQYTNTKVIDSVGRRSVKMVGSGKAVLFMDGKMYKGSWEKTSQKAWTIFRDQKGDEFRLRPGNTWIEVVPTNTKVIFE